MSWFVDNIHIYRECSAPVNLTAEGIDPVEIDLNWNAPAGGGGGGGTGEWLFWDDGVNIDGIGLTGGGTFSVASHWDPDMIADYDGMYLTKISFVPYVNAITTGFTLHVWSGANASNLLHTQALSGLVIGDWNEITLSSPVMIDASQELWFGYTCVQPDGENPAGFDAGPGVVGYGDMISLGSWESISNYGFSLNWNLRAYVTDVTDGTVVPLTYSEDNTVYTNPNATPVNNGAGTPVAIDEAAASRELTGYNVYWNNDGAGYQYLDFTTDTFYPHVVTAPFAIGSVQCYYVEAVYTDCEAASEEVCWIVTSVDEPQLDNAISVYPNPARDIVNVTSSSDIKRVTVMNYVGQVVFDQKVVEDNDFQIAVAGFEAGVYMVKVETTVGIYVKKITVLD